MTEPAALSDDRLRRGSLAMTVGTFASRGTGLVRTMLLVAAVGTLGAVADAFDIANTLPNMLFALLSAGAIQAVLMPQIMAAIAARDSKERLDKLLTLATVVLGVLTVVLVAATPVLIRLFTLVGGWKTDQISLAIAFGYWCVPQVFFYGLFAVLGDALSARGQFAAFGWAPAANNVVSIVGFGAFVAIWGSAGSSGADVATWTTAKTAVLAGTATLGIVVQALLLVVALRRGGFHWKLRLGLHGLGLRTAGKVVGWTLGAVALEQVGVAYMKNVTSAAGAVATATGALAAGNAAYTNALTIYLLPHSLVVVSIVTALFPRMSAAAAAGDIGGVRADMSTGMRLAGVFSVFSAAVLLVLAAPLMKALVPPASVATVRAGAPLLQAMAPGLVALGATVVVKRMYYAFGDGRSIFVIQILATVSMVAVLWLATRVLEAQWWTVAAAAATTLSTWISVLARVRGMRRKLSGIDGRRVLRLHVRAGVAAAVAAGIGWAVLSAMTPGGAVSLRWGHAVLVCAAVGLTMVVVYGILLRVLHVQELDAALAPLVDRLRPRGRRR
ncbi:MAG TPA: lipid II flippase MurJ [Cellulomonas sp.]